MTTDKEIIMNALAKEQFIIQKITEEKNWCAIISQSN
jgi:hypothetical protein